MFCLLVIMFYKLQVPLQVWWLVINVLSKLMPLRVSKYSIFEWWKVGLWSFATFSFNCCSVVDSPHSCTLSTQPMTRTVSTLDLHQKLREIITRTITWMLAWGHVLIKLLYPWTTNNTRGKEGRGLGTSLHHEKQHVPNLHHAQT